MIDSHAHLTDERLLPEIEGVLSRARAAGVLRVVTVATDVEDSAAALDLARTYDNVFSTAGIHPHAANHVSPGAVQRVRELAADPRIVAIGETGLDYFYEHAPKEQQRASFQEQLQMAAELDLPVVVHARDADEDIAAMLRDAPPGVRGVLHCFSSGEQLLRTALERGWYVSFSGMVTFSRFSGADLLRAVPRDRLLVETDSPYLAPVPFRGKRNEPAFVAETVRRVAELLGTDPPEVATTTAANAVALFRLP